MESRNGGTQLESRLFDIHPNIQDPLRKKHNEPIESERQIIITVFLPIFPAYFPAHTPLCSNLIHYTPHRKCQKRLNFEISASGLRGVGLCWGKSRERGEVKKKILNRHESVSLPFWHVLASQSIVDVPWCRKGIARERRLRPVSVLLTVIYTTRPLAFPPHVLDWDLSLQQKSVVQRRKSLCIVDDNSEWKKLLARW